MENPIYGLLDQLTKESRISDFHLRAGEPLAVRASGDIITYPEHIIEQDMLDQVFRHELGEKGYKEFCEKNDVDFCHHGWRTKVPCQWLSNHAWLGHGA